MTTRKKNILLCVSGLTPQIVTETLYALTQRENERVDEIRVITTLAGKRMLCDKLMPALERFADDYGIRPAFDEERIHLLEADNKTYFTDIRAVDDNERAADQICDYVRALARDPSLRLLASAAGGRKTMGIYLTAAMQLFGRDDDRLFHVLVSEPFENHPGFFYPRPTPEMLKTRDGAEVSTAQAEIYLAEIPFIRLRGLINDLPGERYGELVREAQARLSLLEKRHPMRFDIPKQRVYVGKRSVKLTTRELYFFLLFAWLKKHVLESDGFFSLSDLSKREEALEAVFVLQTALLGDKQKLDNIEDAPGKLGFLKIFRGQLKSSKPMDKEEAQRSLEQVVAKIKSKIEKGENPIPAKIYGITSRRVNGKVAYGIALERESIELPEAR